MENIFLNQDCIHQGRNESSSCCVLIIVSPNCSLTLYLTRDTSDCPDGDRPNLRFRNQISCAFFIILSGSCHFSKKNLCSLLWGEANSSLFSYLGYNAYQLASIFSGEMWMLQVQTACNIPRINAVFMAWTIGLAVSNYVLASMCVQYTWQF